MRYKLERTLARMAAGPHSDKFVLKGGLLLAAHAAERPTKDIDSLLRDVRVDERSVRAVCESIATHQTYDGLRFDIDSLSVTEIREDSDYTGYRAKMVCLLHTDRQPVSFDFSTGDPVAPEPERVTIPGLLGDDVEMLGYPLSMSVGEKFNTALQRGAVNTRWRDFTDIALMSRIIEFRAGDITTSLRTVADHRGVTLRPLADAMPVDRFAADGQARYAAWHRKNGMEHRAASTLTDVLAENSRFIDPVLAGGLDDDARWDPTTATWT